MKILAFLDEGSSVSLIDRDTASSIGLKGARATLHLDGLNETPLDTRITARVNCSVSNVLNSKFHDLNGIYVIESLKLPPRSLNKETIESYSHLRDLELSTFEYERPRILLGQDNWDLIVSRKLREGNKNEPVASFTHLGWVVHGNMKSIQPAKRSLFHISKASSFSVTEKAGSNSDENLHELVKQYFALESLGVGKVARKSKSDERALSILEKTTRYCNGYWETGLLWARDDLRLPNNFEGALSRLKAVERKLDRDPAYAALYYKEINRLISEGYAVLSDSVPRDSWFLPHFGVQKSENLDKVRVVLDAAYEYAGVSYNNSLLAGPDLLKSLFGILLS